jgi:hypothetical protein
MLQTLASHPASNFHFLRTGYESWKFYEYPHKTPWAEPWDEVDELEQPAHYQGKRIVTTFFNCTGGYFLNILP